MNEEQRFAFDTWGFFTVEDALTPDQVAELKATTAERGSELYSQRQENGGFWSQAFVDLLDVPAIYFDRDPATDAFDNGLVAVAYESWKTPFVTAAVLVV